ncbi:hypothetical protein [Lysinibacillus parviboronicapiens]|uniref:Uncharacterized protein n=1 Tax=Lysinibacillus parviboronicapiens TaxID=436516 RepID=A0ABV2PN04_9BACI|nr:hypothetical protein [Lysinibacillus parviboronicapiens]
MAYIYGIQNFFDSGSIALIIELLFVTSCVSTILYILTKNQYVSYLSSAPILYILSALFHYSTHLILLVLTMTIQALILLIIKNQKKKQLHVNEQAV